MHAALLRLYVVLDAGTTSPTALPALARAAEDGGATLLQLRDKHATARTLLATVRAIRRASTLPLIINDRVDVAIAADADGAHVGQEDLPVEAARTLLGAHRLLGLSITQLTQLDDVPAGVDHLGVGPVFVSATKQDGAPALGIDALAVCVARARHPIVAIGGITCAHVPAVMATGVSGIAVVGAVAHARDSMRATRALRDAIDHARVVRATHTTVRHTPHVADITRP
ncbi:MAG: thiamine phosphate synthase [Gemmatimonadaceae bacterium]|jgi:thiamine-phosphate pyrophosphorylase|nr:thiamine phosphate synthase [Gemmatimonadaceae bacterium]